MIEKLHITSFKCFHSLNLDIKPLTLFTGLNGSGKSSILQALLALRQSHLGGHLDTGLLLNGSHTALGTADDVLYQWAEEQRIVLGFNENQWHFAYAGTESQYLDVLPLLNEFTQEPVWESSLFNSNFQYLEADRTGPKTSFPTSEFEVRQRRQLGTQGEFTTHFLAIFREEEVLHKRLLHPSASSPTLQEQANAWLREICPGVRLHPARIAEVERAHLRYSFEGTQQLASRPFRAKNVGFGITYTLPIIVALLSAREDALVILENPEAHLHPKGQRHMGFLLGLAAASGIQVLVETHSEQILSGVRLALFAEKLARNDVALYHCTRHERHERFEIDVAAKPPERLHNIDEGPHQFLDQWAEEETALRAAMFEESQLWGAPKATEALAIPEDKSAWEAEDYVRYTNLLLLAGAHLRAQHLAKEGTLRFPTDEALQERTVLLAPPTHIRTSEPREPEGHKLNQEWLQQHKAKYKNQWVVLKNGQLIGAAASLAELKDTLGVERLRHCFIAQVH